MGYECILHYHEYVNGEYNKEETKTKSIKIGSPYDDVSLEILAAKLIAQLARKNMLITNIDIFEFEKKKLSYRETPDGIVIKNRKFSFDDTDMLANSLNVVSIENNIPSQISEVSVPKTEVPVISKTDLTSPPITPNMNIAPPISRPIKYEIFNIDDSEVAKEFRQKKMNFTPGKKYPIYKESPDLKKSYGMLYETIDDQNVKRNVSDKFFAPIVRLMGDFEEDRGNVVDNSGFRDTVNYIKEDILHLRK